jgi:hypothetical protein
LTLYPLENEALIRDRVQIEHCVTYNFGAKTKENGPKKLSFKQPIAMNWLQFPADVFFRIDFYTLELMNFSD